MKSTLIFTLLVGLVQHVTATPMMASVSKVTGGASATDPFYMQKSVLSQHHDRHRYRPDDVQPYGGEAVVLNVRATDIPSFDVGLGNKADPFYQVYSMNNNGQGKLLFQSETHGDTPAPTFYPSEKINAAYFSDPNNLLVFRFWDSDNKSAKAVGYVVISVGQLNGPITGHHLLINCIDFFKKKNHCGRVFISSTFIPQNQFPPQQVPGAIPQGYVGYPGVSPSQGYYPSGPSAAYPPQRQYY